MFTTLIVQPIFNVLSLIYALIPSHDFGMAIILFAIVTRFALFPMQKKQLRHTKAMRELQPELKKIKEAAKGNRQQESIMMMELYKEKEIKPLSQIGLAIIQAVLFIAMFSGLNRVLADPQEMVNFSYGFVQNTAWMQAIAADITKFQQDFFGIIDLSRAAIESGKSLYWPAVLLVLGSAVIQFFQIKQTLPNDKNARKLRHILKEANTGKQADSSEINAAMMKNFVYIMPVMIFVLTIGFPAALALYWFAGGLVSYLFQSYLLKQDEFMMQEASGVVVTKKSLKPEPVTAQTTPSTTSLKTKKQKAKKSGTKSKKRR
jgi:YidC/Oxa1 family membrane protein insertase